MLLTGLYNKFPCDFDQCTKRCQSKQNWNCNKFYALNIDFDVKWVRIQMKWMRAVCAACPVVYFVVNIRTCGKMLHIVQEANAELCMLPLQGVHFFWGKRISNLFVNEVAGSAHVFKTSAVREFRLPLLFKVLYHFLVHLINMCVCAKCLQFFAKGVAFV